MEVLKFAFSRSPAPSLSFFKPGELQAILFDVDGTMYSQRCLYAHLALRMAAPALLQPRRGVEMVRVLLHYRRALEILRQADSPGTIPECQLQVAVQRTGVPQERVRAHVQKWFFDAPLPLLKKCVRPGLTNLLQFARHRGIRLGVYSDYHAEDKLRALGVRDFFEVVASSEDLQVQAYKPNPSGLQATLARMHVEPHRALYIGDRPQVDAEAARRAGLRAVIVGRTHREPGSSWLPVRDFTALRQLLEE